MLSIFSRILSCISLSLLHNSACKKVSLIFFRIIFFILKNSLLIDCLLNEAPKKIQRNIFDFDTKLKITPYRLSIDKASLVQKIVFHGSFSPRFFLSVRCFFLLGFICLSPSETSIQR